MLEPLYTCNLACVGCAVERHTGKLKDRLPLELCLQAVDECGAPAVSLCGGEPTIYPELPDLIEVEDLRGDLQMHSTWSDGKNTIEEMISACALSLPVSTASLARVC